jgi:glycosyltransferase involved in cell wall biosynthesis
MKILIINTLYYPNFIGGSERSVQLLAEALVQDNHQVVVISTSPNPGIKVDWINSVKVYYVGLKNLYWQFGSQENPSILKPLWHTLDSYNPCMAQAVADILDTEQPNLVHTNNIGGFSVLVWQAVKQRKLPLVHTLRDYYLLCARSAMFRKGKNCETPCLYCQPYTLTRRYFSQLPDAVVGISQFILKQHLKLNYFRNTPIQETIFNSFCSTSIPTQASSNKSILRLGYLGRLQADKGIEFLLSTLENLASKNWELWVAGKGTVEYESYLKSRYKLPNIHYLGFINSSELFKKIDFLVVPSLWQEPLGRVVFEAYTYGIPVIVSNRGGIPEMIDEGKTGFIFDPAQPETLLGVLISVRENPMMTVHMHKNCLEKARLFEPEGIGKKYTNLYQEVINKTCLSSSKKL